MGTNKAEEILKTKPFQLIGIDKFYGWNTTIRAMEEYRQSEIEELTKEVERKTNESNDYATQANKYHDLYLSLQSEVERLREEREHSINKLNNLINDCQERADNFLELGMDASEKTSLAMKHAYLEAKNIIKFHPPINQ